MRQRPLVLTLALLAGSSIAGETGHFCRNPDVTRQWQEARVRYPGDALVLRLAAKREILCALLADGTIGLDKSQFLWQKALTDALLERARAKERKRRPLRLFATF